MRSLVSELMQYGCHVWYCNGRTHTAAFLELKPHLSDTLLFSAISFWLSSLSSLASPILHPSTRPISTQL